MYKNAKPFFMFVETPLHAGSGTDLGVIDMPIQRERHTSFPKIEASELKGCIRNTFEEINPKETISLVFGPENGDAHAGALGFTDARLLLFPVKSMKGIFAWITCPKVLEKFKSDLKLAEISDIPETPEANTAPHNCGVFINTKMIVLEEYTLKITKDRSENSKCTKFTSWLSNKILPSGDEYEYWRDKIKKDVVVISDDDFKDFVNLSTEVITRIKIDNKTGTVQSGALFTEEYLPSESILYALALTTPIFKKKGEKGIFENPNEKKEEELVMEYFTKGLPEVVQVGGNTTLGKGIMRTKVWEG